MEIKRYEDMDEIVKDVLREIGSIGTGNAATALSSLLNVEVQMTVPNVEILGYNEAVDYLGNPEEVVSGVLVEMSGDMTGMMLFILKMDFINKMLGELFQKHINDYSELGDMEMSALTEIGNIIISTYILSLSTLGGLDISLSVPAMTVNMLGGILTVPMAAFGYESDKLLMITGKCLVDGKHVESNLLMLPDIPSLNSLMNRLVKSNE